MVVNCFIMHLPFDLLSHFITYYCVDHNCLPNKTCVNIFGGISIENENLVLLKNALSSFCHSNIIQVKILAINCMEIQFSRIEGCKSL